MRRPAPFTVILLGALLVFVAIIVWVRTEPARFVAERVRFHQATILPGDIVFQDLDCGARCELIREATKSRYAHVGIVLRDGSDLVVWEAFHPVGPTPLDEWVDRGRDGRFALYRMSAELTAHLPEIEREVRAMAGRPYDGDYQWDDDRIYCSELIAKGVNRALHREMFVPRPLGAGALGSQAGLVLRMSHSRLTEQTPMVSPRDLTTSPNMTKIFDELAEP
jgi:hypothetical protein